MIDHTLKSVLIDRDIPKSVNYIKHMISEMLQNKLDLSYLVITKSINKSTKNDGKCIYSDDDDSKKSKDSQYKVKQAHIELLEKMKKRDGIGCLINYREFSLDRGSYCVHNGSGYQGFQKLREC